MVLHDGATNQPEERIEVTKKPVEGKEQPVFEGEDAREPGQVAEGARQSMQEAASIIIPTLSPIRLSPLMHSSSLGSTDMDISDSDKDLEDGKYIVITLSRIATGFCFGLEMAAE